MAHHNASLAHGGLYVHTEKPAYLPGECVRGVVYLNAVTTVTSEGIAIKITGREKVEWVWTETIYTPDPNGGPDSVRYVSHDIKGKTEFFKMKVPLHTTEGQIAAGHYEFPFAFDLPHGLPGVFHKHMNAVNGGISQVHASIEYKIKGICDLSGQEDYKHKFNFVLNERVTDEIKGVIKHDKAKVVQCCCIDKGKASLTVRMDKNAYAPGETIQAVCEVDNDSTVEIEKISVRLYRTIELENGHDTRTVHSHDMVSHADFPGVPPQTKYVNDEARYVPLTISGAIEPETHGKLVKCTYHAVCNLDIPYGADICIKLPVAIYAPTPHSQHPPLPAGWSPHVMHAVNLGALPMGVPPPVTAQSFADPFGGNVLPPPPLGVIAVQPKEAPEAHHMS